jgi:signal transduction histidine kinase/CheY-like chemotaxis protein
MSELAPMSVVRASSIPAVRPPTRSRTETVLEGEAQVLEMIVRGSPLPEVLAALCRIAEGAASRPLRVGILLADRELTCLTTGAAPSLPDEYNRAIDGIAIDADGGTCCAAAARNAVVVTTDIATDPGWRRFANLPLALGLKAVWSMPIVSSTGRVLGTFGTYAFETGAPDADEQQLVGVLARIAAVAIERASSDRTLTESQARLDYAVRLSGIGFWYCDLPFSELVWDERVKAHFFLPPEARVTIDTFFERLHPEDRETVRSAIELAIGRRTVYDVVYRTVDPGSGAVRFVRAVGGATYDDAGNPTRFDGVTQDVTEQKLGDQRKDEFIATLAHELRNPLAPIRTGLHLLARGGDPDRAARTRMMMERQLGHLVRMVDDLLDISRITLGKLTLRRERIDFRAALNAALETTAPLVEAAGHEISIRTPEEPLPLDADQTRLAQVLANLINNAAKYTPPKGRIGVTAEREGSDLVVRVSDTGVGIAPAMMSRIFDMFAQADTTPTQVADRGQGGLGIGLTLVRRLVDMHGGTVSAGSGGPGAGSTFTVRLPLAVTPVDVADPSPGGGAVPAGSALRILVVDDNVDAAETLKMLIEDVGHETRIAHSGPDGLAAVDAFQPEVVVLDIGLPGMSGYEVAQRLRAGQAARQPVLIAVTGWGSAEDQRRARAAGFDEHLVKPVDPDRLLGFLEAARTRKAAIEPA